MSYKHLSKNERYQIYALMKAGHNQLEIAQILVRHRSTICREVDQSSALKGYRPKQAQEFACKRAEATRNAPRDPEATLQVAACFLRQDRRPKQVAGLVPVSHETIYRYIYAYKALDGTLWRSLPCQNKKRNRYAGGLNGRGQLPNRRLINDRPAAVKTRSYVANWVDDTVIGNTHQHAIMSVVESRSGFAVMSKVQNKTSEVVNQSIIERLKPYASRDMTLTYDNGKEFADHARVDAELDSTRYFADPFAPMETWK